MTDQLSNALERTRTLTAALTETRQRLADVEAEMRRILVDPVFLLQTPSQVWSMMERTDDSLAAVVVRLQGVLDECSHVDDNGAARRPTHLEGQFLAYISQYVVENQRAPSQSESGAC